MGGRLVHMTSSLHHADKELVVPLNFKNASLVLEGSIRHVHEVRAVLVDVPQSWHGLRLDGILLLQGCRFVAAMERNLLIQWKELSQF